MTGNKYNLQPQHDITCIPYSLVSRRLAAFFNTGDMLNPLFGLHSLQSTVVRFRFSCLVIKVNSDMINKRRPCWLQGHVYSLWLYRYPYLLALMSCPTLGPISLSKAVTIAAAIALASFGQRLLVCARDVESILVVRLALAFWHREAKIETTNDATCF